MKAVVRRMMGLRARIRRSPTPDVENDLSEMSDDSSGDRRQIRQSKKNAAAKMRGHKGEKKRGGNDESGEGSEEIGDEDGDEADGGGHGMIRVKEEDDDEEVEIPRCEMDGSVEGMEEMESRNRHSRRDGMKKMIPAYLKRRSRPPERFKGCSEPRSINSSISPEEMEKQKQYKLVYQKLQQRSKKLGKRQRKHFNKRAEGDPDKKVKDPMIDFEVLERGPRENAEIWDKRAKPGEDKNCYVIDYLVATEERPIGETLQSETEVLIKWTDYPHPTWEPIDQMYNYGDSMRAFDERLVDMDFVELRLRSTLGDAEFEKLFPNRYLEREDGEGNFGYVTNKRSLYVNRLRAIESRWEFVNARDGLPRILIEDWTNLTEDDKALEELMYINYVVMSSAAKKKVTPFNQLEHIKCHGGCVCCVGRKKDDGKSCCSVRGCEISDDYVRVECTSLCSCGHSCKNRVVQKGRQMRLALFRDPNKGWGVRAMREIANDEFIDEYAGEMALEAGKFIYDFPGTFPATERHDSGEELFSLTIRAGEKGNISRFFNHSCEPNLHADNVQIERYGRFFLHIGFFAARKIDAGEELTFNYFENEDEDMSEMLPHGCRCGAKNCLIPPPSQSSRRDVNEDSMGGEDMEEEKVKRGRGGPRKKGSSAHTDDELEKAAMRRRPSERHIEESMDDPPFSSPLESPSKDDKGESGEESGVAKKRSISLGGTREREEEPQSQEDGGRKKAHTVVREEGVKKEGTVVRKIKKLQEIDFSSDEEEKRKERYKKKVARKTKKSPKVEEDPRFDDFCFTISSDDEEEKERLRLIAKRRQERESGMRKVPTSAQFGKAERQLERQNTRKVTPKKMRKALKQINKRDEVDESYHSDERDERGKRGAEDSEEEQESSEEFAPAIRKERVKRARLSSLESDADISIIRMD